MPFFSFSCIHCAINENKGLKISLIAKSSGENIYTTKKINACKTVFKMK